MDLASPLGGLIVEVALEYDVDLDEVRVIAEAPVLWNAWEMDSHVALIEVRGVRLLRVADSTGCEVVPEMLQMRLEAYRDAIQRTEALLSALAEHGPEDGKHVVKPA